jgi:ABC-type branched-subunit amino acid transport system ATPase component
VLSKLKASGQSILIVGKNLKVLARLADRHYVLERGCVRWSGGTWRRPRYGPPVRRRLAGQDHSG